MFWSRSSGRISWVGYGRIQQSTPPEAWSENDDIAKAWHELSVSMEAAGAELTVIARDAHDKEEGFQALSSLLSAALEMKLTKGDPLRPAFTDWMSNHRKFLGDSPDAIYLTAKSLAILIMKSLAIKPMCIIWVSCCMAAYPMAGSSGGEHIKQ